MDQTFLQQLYESHRDTRDVPSPEQVCKVIDGLLGLLFPELSDRHFAGYRDFELQFNSVRLDLHTVLTKLGDSLPGGAERVERDFLDSLPAIHALLIQDAQSIHQGDPAALSVREVIRTYPGFYAIAVYRLAHELLRLGVPLMPRILAEHAHSRTGVDIHPAAIIGARFCIDHGTGIVIGETVEIGDDVKIYQGVTLGALSVEKTMAMTKRHPTIEDRVIIYAGATILGGDTVIGHDSVVGGNVWITKSLPPFSKIYFQLPHKQTTSHG